MPQLTTKPVLALVPFTEKTRPARPYSTYYYDSAIGSAGDWNAIGRAATVKGAIRAAFGRILDEKAERALVHSEYGEVIARLHRTPKGIQVIHIPSFHKVH
ncbi:hypothetical protein UFOVP1254_52 [uncultured Caudovirales phage]|uniref:Uncharacterized protein n=1 Tax=uncultured Caudovirales phage TaxID=2100421 RepID=A0A6J5REM3_9CAUD|nr:hypothetical protein UFOVP1254_52 [uncultured Caudovirales phage]